MAKKKKKKQRKIYDSEYISYVERGYSAAVFITRDVVDSIDTTGKWIEILDTESDKNKWDQWDFKSIMVEIFPRKINPVYPKNSDIDEKHYITWKTAQKDIAAQRLENYVGEKFKILPKLVKVAKTIKSRVTDSEFGIKEKVTVVGHEWQYHILSVKRL